MGWMDEDFEKNEQLRLKEQFDKTLKAAWEAGSQPREVLVREDLLIQWLKDGGMSDEDIKKKLDTLRE